MLVIKMQFVATQINFDNNCSFGMWTLIFGCYTFGFVGDLTEYLNSLV